MTALQVRLMTERGFSHTLLHSVNATVRPMLCRDLNETRLITAVPDTFMKNRAYGISTNGELVSLSLPGEKRVLSCRCAEVTFAMSWSKGHRTAYSDAHCTWTAIDVCRMRFKRGEIQLSPTATMQVVNDGLLIADQHRLLVFNSSGRGEFRFPTVQDDMSSFLRRIPTP
jgi:hypothetical protein